MCDKPLLMEDVEYKPQRGIGTPALLSACVATVLALILLSLSPQTPAATYAAVFPAAAALAWFARYAAQRRLRCRLTATGIEIRRIRTRSIPWLQIRDVQVVTWATVANVTVLGNRATGRYGSRSGRGKRKLAAVRVQRANGRWLELPMPVARENAPDPEFMNKARVIEDRWRTGTGQPPVRDGRRPDGGIGAG
jgi:hypothetical protein